MLSKIFCYRKFFVIDNLLLSHIFWYHPLFVLEHFVKLSKVFLIEHYYRKFYVIDKLLLSIIILYYKFFVIEHFFKLFLLSNNVCIIFDEFFVGKFTDPKYRLSRSVIIESIFVIVIEHFMVSIIFITVNYCYRKFLLSNNVCTIF